MGGAWGCMVPQCMHAPSTAVVRSGYNALGNMISCSTSWLAVDLV